MPVDRTYPALRCAIWEAHDRQCCYCRVPLNFGDLQIDHVIPEAVINDAVEWPKMMLALNFSGLFDPQGLENFVASCSTCNRRKSGTPFDPITALIPLRVAARLKPNINRRIRQLERQAKETVLEVLIEMRRMFDAQPPAKPDREP